MSMDVEEVGRSYSQQIRDWIAGSGGRPRLTIEISRLGDGLKLRTSGLNRQHVRLLAEISESLPPIVVHRSSMRVIDGLHRVRAAQLAGRFEIDIEYFDGTEDEAFALSVHLNVGHGLPLGMDDRKAAASVILSKNAEWSDRFVAHLVGLSHKTVSAIRCRSTGDNAQSNSRVGRDGKLRPVDPVGGRLRAARLCSDHPSMPLRELASLAGVSISTARDVRLRLQSGRDAVPDRFRSGRHGQTETSSECGPPPAREEQSGPPVGPVDLHPSASHDAKESAGSRLASAGSLLERLRKDPAVRFNEAGRAMVRHLVMTRTILAQIEDSACGVPPHCFDTLAELAHHYAAEWNALAHSIELRSRCDDEWMQSS